MELETETPGRLVNLTDSACDEVRRLLTEPDNLGKALRLGIKGGGCSGLSYIIDLDLRNGETYSLSPGDKPDHFKDQKGNKVVRTQAGGNTQEFKWDGGKKVTVTFGASSSSSSSGGSVTETPADLQDLVHGRRVGGEVDDELMRRGWRQGKSEVAGDEVYSYWGKGSRCVVVHFNASRHVSSIANAFESSCR